MAARLAAVPPRVRDLVTSADDATLRTRPPAGGWSALEYVGHLKDLTAFHRWLIERALTEESPLIGPADPDAAVAAAAYIEADPGVLVEQFERRITRLGDLLVTLDDAAARRPLTVEPGPITIDITFVARSALHECHHHSLDLVHLLGADEP